jgi:hypothetical protein
MPPALLLLRCCWWWWWWWWQIQVSRDSLMSDWIYLLAFLLCFCTDRTPYYIILYYAASQAGILDLVIISLEAAIKPHNKKSEVLVNALLVCCFFLVVMMMCRMMWCVVWYYYCTTTPPYTR